MAYTAIPGYEERLSWADLGAGGPGFKSPHPDGYLSNVLSEAPPAETFRQDNPSSPARGVHRRIPRTASPDIHGSADRHNQSSSPHENLPFSLSSRQRNLRCCYRARAVVVTAPAGAGRARFLVLGSAAR